jgi:microcystin-dependent protein
MTVETQTKEVNVPSSASTFIYSFSPIVIFSASDLVVTLTNDTTGIETTLNQGTTSTTYEVIVSSFPGTGSITYPGDEDEKAGTGSTINIKRVLTLEQATDFENQGGYFPDTLEEALDKNIMVDLQQQEEIDRSFQAAISETSLTTLKLPNTSTVTGAANLGVSADHTKLEFNVSAGTLPDPVTVARGGTGSTTVASAQTALNIAGTDLSNTFTKLQILTKGGDIVSASPLVLDTDGNYFDVTGTTGFSTITCTAGSLFILQFDGALVMTDGATLDLGGSNITTAAGDRGIFFATAANAAQLVSWSAEGSVASSGTPSGTIVDYAGTTEPSGWVFCDGAAYNSTSDTTFSDLYAAISNVYGGSSATDFQVPDMRGRVGVGQDDMGGSSANRIVETEAHGVNGDTLGAVGGVGQHAITTAEMAAHTHGSAGAHTHTQRVETSSENVGASNCTSTGNDPNSSNGGETASSGSHSHSSVGSGTAHTNLQPSLIINKIIKK